MDLSFSCFSVVVLAALRTQHVERVGRRARGRVVVEDRSLDPLPLRADELLRLVADVETGLHAEVDGDEFLRDVGHGRVSFQVRWIHSGNRPSRARARRAWNSRR